MKKRVFALILSLIMLVAAMPALADGETDAYGQDPETQEDNGAFVGPASTPITVENGATSATGSSVLGIYTRLDNTESVLFTVVDDDTNLAIGTATVSVVGTGGAFSAKRVNSKGEAEIDVVYSTADTASTYDYAASAPGYSSKTVTGDKFYPNNAYRTIRLKKASTTTTEMDIGVFDALDRITPIDGAVLWLKNKRTLEESYHVADEEGAIKLSIDNQALYTYRLSDPAGDYLTDNGDLGELKKDTMPRKMYLYPKSVENNKAQIFFDVYDDVSPAKPSLIGAIITVTYANGRVQPLTTGADGKTDTIDPYVGETILYTAAYSDGGKTYAMVNPSPGSLLVADNAKEKEEVPMQSVENVTFIVIDGVTGVRISEYMDDLSGLFLTVGQIGRADISAALDAATAQAVAQLNMENVSASAVRTVTAPSPGTVTSRGRSIVFSTTTNGKYAQQMTMADIAAYANGTKSLTFIDSNNTSSSITGKVPVAIPRKASKLRFIVKDRTSGEYIGGADIVLQSASGSEIARGTTSSNAADKGVVDLTPNAIDIGANVVYKLLVKATGYKTYGVSNTEGKEIRLYGGWRNPTHVASTWHNDEQLLEVEIEMDTTADVKFTVVDKSNKNTPISGAVVTAVDADGGVVSGKTGADGTVTLAVKVGANYTYTAYKSGYRDTDAAARQATVLSDTENVTIPLDKRSGTFKETFLYVRDQANPNPLIPNAAFSLSEVGNPNVTDTYYSDGQGKLTVDFETGKNYVYELGAETYITRTGAISSSTIPKSSTLYLDKAPTGGSTAGKGYITVVDENGAPKSGAKVLLRNKATDAVVGQKTTDALGGVNYDVTFDTEYEYFVEATGYRTVSGSKTFTENDANVIVQLEKRTGTTVTKTVLVKDAISKAAVPYALLTLTNLSTDDTDTYIANASGSISVSMVAGNNYDYVLSGTGYITDNGKLGQINSTTIPGTMYLYRENAEQITLTFNVTDSVTKQTIADSEITVTRADGTKRTLTGNTVVVYKGEPISYTVKKAGYKDGAGSATRAQDDTIPVALVPDTVAVTRIVTVTDKATGKIIPGAKVILTKPDGTTQEYTAGADGKVNMQLVGGATYSYTISATGYDSLTVGPFQQTDATLAETKALQAGGIGSGLTITIHVKSKATNSPISGATVKVTRADGASQTLTTDSSGNATFQATSGASYTYTVSHSDYYSVSSGTRTYTSSVTDTVLLSWAGKGDEPKTGDTTCALHWYMLACMAASALYFVLRIFKKKDGTRLIDWIVTAMIVVASAIFALKGGCSIDRILAVLWLCMTAVFLLMSRSADRRRDAE